MSSLNKGSESYTEQSLSKTSLIGLFFVAFFAIIILSWKALAELFNKPKKVTIEPDEDGGNWYNFTRP